MQEFISKINWVDLAILILIARICYVSWHIGVGKQILPLISLIFILVLSFNNYHRMGISWINIFGISRSVSKFISYLVLVIVPMLVVTQINKFWMKYTGEYGDLPLFERVGGLILGLLRANVIIGLIVVGLLLTPVDLIEVSAKKHSHLSKFFINSNLNIYCAIMNILPSKEKKSTSQELKKMTEDKDYKMEFIGVKTKASDKGE